MNNPVHFTATYKHYQMTALRFTMELDRLTDQADIIQGEAEKTNKSVQNLVAIAGHIEKEVEKALIAWGNNSTLVKETAKAAHNAATSGVQQATNALVSKINTATSEANHAVAELRKMQRSVRWLFAALALAFLAGSGSTYAVARFGFGIGIEYEARKVESYQSKLLSTYWKHATSKQKQDFERIVEGKPQ